MYFECAWIENKKKSKLRYSKVRKITRHRPVGLTNLQFQQNVIKFAFNGQLDYNTARTEWNNDVNALSRYHNIYG